MELNVKCYFLLKKKTVLKDGTTVFEYNTNKGAISFIEEPAFEESLLDFYTKHNHNKNYLTNLVKIRILYKKMLKLTREKDEKERANLNSKFFEGFTSVFKTKLDMIISDNLGELPF